ncbi:MAG: hypothetical protein AC479_05965 [miscellaneous Crenarchaeota group-6 archaeon AD8-1]|nr:MAG: hypothetical protein AC479_05965 [miscellaneous Crenarchaeota group-6 archaeon AD8-1]
MIITILNRDKCIENPVEIGLDKDWKVKVRHFDKRFLMKGIYILHFADPLRIIYVGKTRGSTMDFNTRIYRHATEAASRGSQVYQKLKEINKETGKPVLVSLITTNQLRTLFRGKTLKDSAMIDIYEQILIHSLHPELNSR